MLTEMRDSVGVVAASLGYDPETASPRRVPGGRREDRTRPSESGQIRGFTGNEFTKDITKGDSWIIIGWSGDSVQLQADNPDIRFVAPESGVHLWTDNMQIPVGAPNAYTAEKMIDFVYRPEVQADIAEYVNYICPVEGVQEILEKRDPALASNQLIFPDDKTLFHRSSSGSLSRQRRAELDEAFQKVIGA